MVVLLHCGWLEEEETSMRTKAGLVVRTEGGGAKGFEKLKADANQAILAGKDQKVRLSGGIGVSAPVTPNH
jgi:hypothetical protein